MESLTDEQRSLFADGGQMDDYEVLKPIGKGKFSVVFKAKRRCDGQAVALKKIAIFDMMNLKAREKTLKEVRLVQSVSHPNIIQYLDAFVQNNELYIAFEWAEAGDLKRQIRKANEKGVRFDERTIWRYFTQLCGAILYLHQGRIMHRDLKPANIFLTLKGVVKVGDLGLGRYLSENTVEARSKVGTPLYMSPEVLRGESYDWKSDVWSMGCILYELAMLRSPFKSEGLNLVGLFQKINKGHYEDIPEVYSEHLRGLVKNPVAWELERRRMLPKLQAVLQGKLRQRPAETSWRVRLDQMQTQAGAIVVGQDGMQREIGLIQASRQHQSDQLERYEKQLNKRYLRARRLYDEETARLSKSHGILEIAQGNVNRATVEIARLQTARSEQANAVNATEARLTDNSTLLERKRQVRHLIDENRELGLKLQVLHDYWTRKQQQCSHRKFV
ncbi:Serine/threonine-protein kinase Nek6 [Phytophthora ramorum]|uniref:Serine/threonine-protein kinase Nek6 n=1 Tax=Phytophthora ramorum TaxID=164328 RepID=UPI0030AB1849|nr:Serine/threonine-protein kinase Nek6 [Phytophthora ramorum]